MVPNCFAGGLTNLHSFLFLLNKIMGHLQPVLPLIPRTGIVWKMSQLVKAENGCVNKCTRDKASSSLSLAVQPVPRTQHRRKEAPVAAGSPGPHWWAGSHRGWGPEGLGFPHSRVQASVHSLLHITRVRGWMGTLRSAPVL